MYAERILKTNCNGFEQDIAVRLFPPEQVEDNWTCEFEIHWPSNTQKMQTLGEDGMQALLMAMMQIGTIVYSSDLHKRKQLYWLEFGDGYGFPLVNSIRELAEGSDRLA